MNILVAGGAGYIGSHMVEHLTRAGHRVVVVDNFSTGFRSSFASAGPMELVEIDIADTTRLANLLEAHNFDAVMHFASYIQVGESVGDPGRYYANNFAATLSLLQAMTRTKVLRLIFSSSAAVYGNPMYSPIDEAHPKAPTSPYGRSKWMVEQMLEDFDRAHGLRSVSLRYFNAAGADSGGHLGERHEPESHLIPIVLQVAAGRRKAITIFGQDYDTPDGTCIRDYIHVVDLVDAHEKALSYLIAGGASVALNLGNGCGYSVRQVIDTASHVTKQKIKVLSAQRRMGDPARLVADALLAREKLGWNPKYPELTTIIRHAWAWEQKWPWQ